MYYTPQTKVFLDGKYIAAEEATGSLYDQGLHYGSSVFEGIRSYGYDGAAHIFKAKEHYERLHYSAEMMHLKLPYTVQELTDISYELLRLNDIEDAYIRPLVYPNANMSLSPASETHVFICVWKWGNYLGHQLLRLKLSPYQRPNPMSTYTDAKISGNYVNSILATTDAKRSGYDEALLLDANGYVAEGPGANFFMEKDGVLYTAPKGNILMGITRATVIEIAAMRGIPVVEKLFTLEELYQADSAFYCGTAAEVAGIQSVGDFHFPMAWEDSLGYKLQVGYKALVLGKPIPTFV